MQNLHLISLLSFRPRFLFSSLLVDSRRTVAVGAAVGACTQGGLGKLRCPPDSTKNLDPMIHTLAAGSTASVAVAATETTPSFCTKLKYNTLLCCSTSKLPPSSVTLADTDTLTRKRKVP